MRPPSPDILKFYLRYYLILSVAFFVVYGGANYWASLQLDRYELFLPVERHIPFIPQSVLVYLSVFLLFILPVFYLDKPEIRRLSNAFLFTLLVAGVFFVFFPAQLMHDRPNEVAFMPIIFDLLYWFALPHNLTPSLHIAFTVLFLNICASKETSSWLIGFYIVWGLLLFASVLLMRQHQLIDLPTGSLLGWVAYRFVYRPSLG